MIGCLISLIIFVIVLAIVYYVLKMVLDLFISLPYPVWQLVGVLFGLLVLVQALGCLGFLEPMWAWPRGRY